MNIYRCAWFCRSRVSNIDKRDGSALDDHAIDRKRQEADFGAAPPRMLDCRALVTARVARSIAGKSAGRRVVKPMRFE